MDMTLDDIINVAKELGISHLTLDELQRDRVAFERLEDALIESESVIDVEAEEAEDEA